jgi:hypothetical protein
MSMRIRIQRFYDKNCKFTANPKSEKIFLLIKKRTYLSLGNHERSPSCRRSPQHSKKNIQHLKHENFSLYSIFVGNISLLGPDPGDQNQCGSGSATLDHVFMILACDHKCDENAKRSIIKSINDETRKITVVSMVSRIKNFCH